MTNTYVKIKGKDETRKAFGSVGKNLDGLKSRLGGVHAKLGALIGVAGFGALVKVSKDAIDAQSKTADKLGITTEALGRLHHITSLYTSTSAPQMNEALAKAQKRLGEYNNTGSGAAAQWLKKLNLDTQALAQLSPDQLFHTYAEAVRGLNDRGSQLAAISALMGDKSRDLIGIVDAMPESLAAAAAEADALGLTFSRIDGAKVEAANDSLTRVKGLTTGFGTQLTIALAPAIEGVANHLVKASIEAGGFGTIATNMVDGLITGVGFAMDAFRGLQVVWGLLKTGFLGLSGIVLNGLNAMVEGAVGFINMIPGVDITPFEGLKNLAAGIEQKFIDAQVQLIDLVATPMPSENLKKWSAEAQAEIQAVAEKKAALDPAAEGVGQVNLVDKAAAKDQERLQARLDRLNQSLMSEQERLRQDHEQKEIILAESFAAGLINEQVRKDQLLLLNEQYQDKLTAIELRGLTERQKFERKSISEKIKFQLNSMSQMTQGLASSSKSFFNINKKLSLANAAATLPDAVLQTFRNNGGWPWGAIPAALMAATGARQISAIRNSSFGGGASTPSVGGGGAAVVPPSLIGTGVSDVVGTQPVNGGNQGAVTNIYFQGNVMDEAYIMDTVVPAIREGVDTRDINIIPVGSRNALDLAEAAQADS